MTHYLEGAERALSPMEQTICVADALCSMNFVMHCEILGPLGEDPLRAGLARVQARHPLLRMRLHGTDGNWWFRPVDEPIPLRVVDGPPSAMAAEVENELHRGFDCARGPMLRSVWMRHAPEHSTLLVTFHHLIGDGISGGFLLRDLIRAMRGEPLGVLGLADSLDGHLPSSARGLRGLAGLMRLAARRLGRIVRHGPLRHLPPEGAGNLAERRAAVRMTRLQPDIVGALAARAREERTTLHGALSAAIVMASVPEIGTADAHIAFSSALDMRDRFSPPVGEDLGLYATLAYSTHVIHEGTAFWPLARELKQGLNRAIDSGQPFVGLAGLAPWIMARYRNAGGGEAGRRTVARVISRGMVKAFALTNIGRVAIEVGNGPFGISSLGFAVSLSVLGSSAFTAATIGGTLCLNSIVMEPVVSRETQGRIVDRLQGILHAALYCRPAAEASVTAEP